MKQLGELVRNAPMIGPLARRLLLRWKARRSAFASFPGSASYWEDRYREGGNSGAGSFGRLAEFKAQFLNSFVERQCASLVVELGCGDGNQLRLARYPAYVGFDVSPTAVTLCRELFREDPTKSFHLTEDHNGQVGDLALSLDVIYHLVEDDAYDRHMALLFDSSSSFVIVYSSDLDGPRDESPYIRHRKFTEWVTSNRPDWTLIEHMPNRFPYAGDYRTSSVSEFFVYQRS